MPSVWLADDYTLKKYTFSSGLLFKIKIWGGGLKLFFSYINIIWLSIPLGIRVEWYCGINLVPGRTRLLAQKEVKAGFITRGLRHPCYLSMRPTNARIWHKAVFKVGLVAEPKPTRVRQGQKYLRPRRHSPFLGRQAINPTPEGGKSLEGWPPEAGGNLQCWGTPGRIAQR